MHGLIFETSICYWQDQPGSFVCFVLNNCLFSLISFLSFVCFQTNKKKEKKENAQLKTNLNPMKGRE
jgi:hypothetical protein